MQSHSFTQRGGIVGRLLIFVLILGVFAAGTLGYLAYRYNEKVNAAGPLETTDVLWIEFGNGVETVGEKLITLGAIDDPRVFKWAARLEKLAPALRAGEYEIPAGASMSEIIRILKEEKPMLRFVTVAEGLTTAQVFRRVRDADFLEGDITLTPAEGTLLPETYSYHRGDTRDDVIQHMVDAQVAVMEELWPMRADDLPIDTPEEALILASIVEKETAVAAERARVAAVFVNRLRRGMRLQSDPTIIYGLQCQDPFAESCGEPLGRGIRQSELRGETPYNTYIIRGLTPTPIANPGRDSIAAVLNPAETDDLYFVADGTGGHAFSKTLAEHNRNVAQWRRIERERAQGN